MAFDLASIKSGPTSKPPRIIVYGPEGIGKSTWASQAPKPIFIQTEDGLMGLTVATWEEKAKQYSDVLEMVDALLAGGHDYRTVVIDSIDWCEALLFKKVAEDAKKKSVEDFGFGKGYVKAEEELRELLEKLNTLRDKGMIVILIAHSKTERVDDPVLGSYLHASLKLQKRIRAACVEWADVVGYVHEEGYVNTEEVDSTTVRRVHGTGKRILGVERSLNYAAKNRLHLPAILPFEWSALTEATASKEKTVTA